MSNHEARLAKLEKKLTPGMSNDELAARVNHVLENPNLVSPQTYSRIIELVEIAKARKAAA